MKIKFESTGITDEGIEREYTLTIDTKYENGNPVFINNLSHGGFHQFRTLLILAIKYAGLEVHDELHENGKYPSEQFGFPDFQPYGKLTIMDEENRETFSLIGRSTDGYLDLGLSNRHETGAFLLGYSGYAYNDESQTVSFLPGVMISKICPNISKFLINTFIFYTPEKDVQCIDKLFSTVRKIDFSDSTKKIMETPDGDKYDLNMGVYATTIKASNYGNVFVFCARPNTDERGQEFTFNYLTNFIMENVEYCGKNNAICYLNIVEDPEYKKICEFDDEVTTVKQYMDMANDIVDNMAEALTNFIDAMKDKYGIGHVSVFDGSDPNVGTDIGELLKGLNLSDAESNEITNMILNSRNSKDFKSGLGIGAITFDENGQPKLTTIGIPEEIADGVRNADNKEEAINDALDIIHQNPEFDDIPDEIIRKVLEDTANDN